jgi:hypothetical protein
MHKYTYEDVGVDEDKTDVAFHNMKIADQIHKLQIFIGGMAGYFNANPSKTYQDLELELRNRNFDAHLIAKQPPQNNKQVLYRLFMPNIKNDQTEYKYECIMSCRPKEYALKELLETWGSYEENFEALKFSGMVCAVDANKPPIEKHQLSELYGNLERIDMVGETDPIRQMQNNLVKVKATFISVEEFVSDIFAKTKLEHGEDPKLSLYAMSHTGAPIMAIVLGDKIMSNMGIMIQYEIQYEMSDDEQKKQVMSLVDLTNLG